MLLVLTFHNSTRALKECLSVTEQLEILVLQSVSLRSRDLNSLSKVLADFILLQRKILAISHDHVNNLCRLCFDE